MILMMILLYFHMVSIWDPWIFHILLGPQSGSAPKWLRKAASPMSGIWVRRIPPVWDRHGQIHCLSVFVFLFQLLPLVFLIFFGALLLILALIIVVTVVLLVVFVVVLLLLSSCWWPCFVPISSLYGSRVPLWEGWDWGDRNRKNYSDVSSGMWLRLTMRYPTIPSC